MTINYSRSIIAGTGESDPVDEPYTLDDLADDTVALMDHVDWPDAHIVGVSMGGMVAQHLALRHRERVKSLTLIATSPNPANLLLPTIEGLKQFAKANTSTDEARLRALLNLLIPLPSTHVSRRTLAGILLNRTS